MADFTLVTKRKSMTVEVDGKERELPLQPTADELNDQIARMNVSVTFDDDGNPKMDGLRSDAVVGMREWFLDYAERYLGGSVREAGSDALQALIDAWNAKREEVLGVSEGEA